MNNKISINYIIIVFLCVLSLGVLFVFINNGTINTKALDSSLEKVNEKISIPTTITSVVKKDTISVNGVLTEIVIDTMHSYLGFSINYDKENMKYEVLSNASVIFSDVNNKNNFFKLIKLTESEYKLKYEQSVNNELHENELDNNIYNYEFYRVGDNRFEIIECIDSNDDLRDYYSAMYKYMISTLNEH